MSSRVRLSRRTGVMPAALAGAGGRIDVHEFEHRQEGAVVYQGDGATSR